MYGFAAAAIGNAHGVSLICVICKSWAQSLIQNDPGYIFEYNCETNVRMFAFQIVNAEICYFYNINIVQLLAFRTKELQVLLGKNPIL